MSLINISVTVTTTGAATALGNIIQGLTPQAIDSVLGGVAARTHANLVRATPKRFTGLTRQKWTILRRVGRGYFVTNPSKIMLFLEEGTRAHGPVRARALFIPLTRDAALNGYRPGMEFGVDFVMAKRVRGIRAMRIVARERDRTRDRLYRDMTAYINQLIG